MGSSGSTVSSDIACNGNAALCSRSWSNVTLIGTHDSAFVGIWPTDNQADTVTQQLDAGIRFLQAQTHSKSGVLELCHTSCTELDAGRKSVLRGISPQAGISDKRRPANDLP